jgi:hypothetical protein
MMTFRSVRDADMQFAQKTRWRLRISQKICGDVFSKKRCTNFNVALHHEVAANIRDARVQINRVWSSGI